MHFRKPALGHCVFLYIMGVELYRNCWFYTDTDVRGKLGWDSFCEIELPIPSIEKQNEIVKEYNIVVNRIKLNEQLNQKLEETAQALYKHWFVDFEFPNEEGKPYKSSGGEMFYNEELDGDIPLGWSIEFLGNIIESFSKNFLVGEMHLRNLCIKALKQSMHFRIKIPYPRQFCTLYVWVVFHYFVHFHYQDTIHSFIVILWHHTKYYSSNLIYFHSLIPVIKL